MECPAHGIFAKFRRLGNWYGVAKGYTVYAMPFDFLVAGAALRTFDVAREHAALGLDAGISPIKP